MKIKTSFKKEDLEKLGKSILRKAKKTPDFLASNAFWVFFIGFALEIVVGVLVFYQYSFPSDYIPEKRLNLEKEVLEQAVGEAKERKNEEFKETEEAYPDFFPEENVFEEESSSVD